MDLTVIVSGMNSLRKENDENSDEILLREAITSNMKEFRSSWFTFNGLQRSIIFMMAPLGALVAIYPTWKLIMVRLKDIYEKFRPFFGLCQNYVKTIDFKIAIGMLNLVFFQNFQEF